MILGTTAEPFDKAPTQCRAHGQRLRRFVQGQRRVDGRGASGNMDWRLMDGQHEMAISHVAAMSRPPVLRHGQGKPAGRSTMHSAVPSMKSASCGGEMAGRS